MCDKMTREKQWQQIVSAWRVLERGIYDDPKAEHERFTRIRIAHAPEFRGGALPVEGEASPVIDWWPIDQIEERRTYLKENGPFVNWETRSGEISTAKALSRASGEERIAVWMEGALWEKGKRHRWPASWNGHGIMKAFQTAYIAAAVRLNASGLHFRHHACSSAFPWASEELLLRLEEWLGAINFASGSAAHGLERIVEYALLRRALVLSQWALIEVAAVRGGLTALPAAERG